MTTLRAALHTFAWGQPGQRFRLLVAGLMLAVLSLGSIFALRLLFPADPALLLPGQRLAWDIAETIRQAPGVQFASGAFLPGDSLLLYSRVDEQDRARVRAWAVMQLEPFRERLMATENGEQIKWVIDFGPAPAAQEVLMAPLQRGADATYYRYLSTAPPLLAAPAAANSGETAVSTANNPVTTAQPTVNASPATAANVPPTTVPAASVPVENVPVENVPANNAPANNAPAANGPAAAPMASNNQSATRTDVTAPEEPTVLQSLDFASPAAQESLWQPISGEWVFTDGVYRQVRTTGYDYISFLNLPPQSHYSLEAQLRLGTGTMGGGYIYNAPNANSRVGAQVIDFDQQGSFLRWGRYDDKGSYVYEGGTKVTPPINDGKWHTLQLFTHAEQSVISLNGRVVGQIKNQSAGGYLGLIASQTTVDFDNITLTALPATDTGRAAAPATAPTAAAPTAPVPAVAPLGSDLKDDFADGNANGWRVLNGTWQVVNGAYEQQSIAGTDLGTISTFQGDTYTVTVRLQRLDGSMGGGLYFNMAQRDVKMRSQMINYTRSGKAIQWGHFDDGGNFVFDDLVEVPDASDGNWHTLRVSVRNGKAAFAVDGVTLAEEVTLTYPSGYVGLLVSNSKVAFDDFTVVTP